MRSPAEARFPREAGKTTHAFEMLLLERKRNSRVIEPRSRLGSSESGSVRAMGSPTPEQAVIDELSRPPGTITDLAEPQPGAPTPSIVTGGLGFVADLDTLRFVKHRQAGERHVFYVTFAAEHPRLGLLEMQHAYPVEPAPDGGWRTFGGAGGAGTLSGRATQPGVNLGGGAWPDHFYAGGEIYRAGADIAQVELRFANGVTLSDDADADVALFITESSVQLPATAVLLDPAGNEIRSETAFR
jgi:hypothetical protein